MRAGAAPCRTRPFPAGSAAPAQPRASPSATATATAPLGKGPVSGHGGARGEREEGSPAVPRQPHLAASQLLTAWGAARRGAWRLHGNRQGFVTGAGVGPQGHCDAASGGCLEGPESPCCSLSGERLREEAAAPLGARDCASVRGRGDEQEAREEGQLPARHRAATRAGSPPGAGRRGREREGTAPKRHSSGVRRCALSSSGRGTAPAGQGDALGHS